MSTVITVVGLLIGAMILGAGLYFRSKSKGDKESQRIYGITSVIGAAILIGLIIKILIAGW